LLLAHRDQLLTSDLLDVRSRSHLRQRIKLAEVPVQELWEQLLERAAEVDDDSDEIDFESSIADRLVEAIARKPEEVLPRVMDLLRFDQKGSWAEIYAAKIAGAIRYEPAVDFLINALAIDNDALRIEATDALTRIGTVDVVRRLQQFYPGNAPGARVYAAIPLEQIKRPESEAALIELLAMENDEEVAAPLAESLCMLCPSPETLSSLRDRWARGDFDEDGFNVPAMILAAAAFVGYEPPEAHEWLEEIGSREKSLEELMTGGGSLFDLPDKLQGTIEAMRRSLESDGGDELPILPNAAARGAGEHATLPIRREAPKIGRNDPCPCGSGKKYKKCCLDKD
jgi:hypothetical protein